MAEKNNEKEADEIVPTVGMILDVGSLHQYIENQKKYVEKRKERELLEKAGYDHL